MSIVKVIIKNCKSVDHFDLNLNNNMSCFVGSNNVGKTNIMKSIHFFYKNLSKAENDTSFFNNNNPYDQNIEITIVYDFSGLIRKAQRSIDAVISNEIFERILVYSDKYCNEDKKITLTLIKSKSGKTKWSIEDYDFNLFIATRFPVFYLESRNIDLFNWQSLWGLIGSIAPFRQKLIIHDQIEGIFDLKEDQKNNYKEVIDTVLEVFNKSNIRLERSTIYEKISQIIQLQLGGGAFDYNDHSLKLGSYGINSFTYIELYTNLILRLFESKHLAIPLIMVDEPELHLHPKKIGELVYSIRENPNYKEIKWIFSTHSPTFIKYLITNNNSVDFFHVTNTPVFNKTDVTKMIDFKNQEKHMLISDKEASLYFSEACLFVEGDTEQELFNNRVIHMLYPKFQKFDVYSFESKNDKLKLVNPKDKKTKIVYLVLIDLDKIISYNHLTLKFKPSSNKYINVLSDKKLEQREKYHFGDKFINTYKKRINALRDIDRVKFSVDDSGLCFKEVQSRSELNRSIQRYLKNYNIYPLETTIEGTIINEGNFLIFLEWLTEAVGRIPDLEDLLNNMTSDTHSTALLRVLFMGKSEWLNGEKETKKNQNFHSLYQKIVKIRNQINSRVELVDKTSGWVSDFINWYADKHLPKQNNIFLNRSIFQKNFPELGILLDHLEEMI